MHWSAAESLYKVLLPADVASVRSLSDKAVYERLITCGECIHYTDGMCAYPDGDGGYLLIEKDPNGFCDWGRKDNE